MTTDAVPEWIHELTAQNFLAVYDITLDIKEALQLSDGDVVIPLLQYLVKFKELLPADTIPMRDRYCELRWNAVGLMKKHGVITGYELLHAFHRWQSRLRITIDMPSFLSFVEMIDTQYKQRIKSRSSTDISEEIWSSVAIREPIDELRRLILRFHTVVTRLRDRHESRSTLDVNDEYDVQDLLHALLCLHFDDVRREEWTPSYAGKASRVDFLLKPEQIVIEVKKTRQGLAAKEVGDQLIVDIARYIKMSDCKMLVCMVYDPENRITNPGGLQADLSSIIKEGIQVEVIIVPKQY